MGEILCGWSGRCGLLLPGAHPPLHHRPQPHGLPCHPCLHRVPLLSGGGYKQVVAMELVVAMKLVVAMTTSIMCISSPSPRVPCGGKSVAWACPTTTTCAAKLRQATSGSSFTVPLKSCRPSRRRRRSWYGRLWAPMAARSVVLCCVSSRVFVDSEQLLVFGGHGC